MRACVLNLYVNFQDGRDKIYRFAQYYAKYLESTTTNKENAAHYNKLSGSLGMSRKRTSLYFVVTWFFCFVL